MKRVLRLVTRLNRGGPTRQIAALQPALAEFGWDGIVVAGRGPAWEGDARADPAWAQVECRTWPGMVPRVSPAEDLRAYVALRALVRRTCPDVIHTHMGKAGWLGRRVAREAGIPVVHTFHGHHFQRAGWQGSVARRIERGQVASSSALIALSVRQAADLATFLGPAAAAKTKVIGPAFDARSWHRAATPAPVPSSASEPWTVVWLGRFVRVKDVPLLLEAFARCPAAMRLVLLGDGPERLRCLRLARALGVESRTTFAGVVADPQPWLRRAAVVALSSSSEGTPLALLEAMSMGLPVVAPAVGGIPDIVEHEHTGLLFPAGDAGALAAHLGRLFEDGEWARGLGAAAAIDVAGRYSPARAARETADLYERVLLCGSA